jgi:hypothetical protein
MNSLKRQGSCSGAVADSPRQQRKSSRPQQTSRSHAIEIRS